ncbi:hypothetical protein COLO4_03487, partial [Corchorus olitorius]
MFYRRPGFLLCDGLKPIINDDSILDMTGEMYLNNGFIDVYLEHGIDDVVQVELFENVPAEDHNGHEQNGGLGKDGLGNEAVGGENLGPEDHFGEPVEGQG